MKYQSWTTAAVLVVQHSSNLKREGHGTNMYTFCIIRPCGGCLLGGEYYTHSNSQLREEQLKCQECWKLPVQRCSSTQLSKYFLSLREKGPRLFCANLQFLVENFVENSPVHSSSSMFSLLVQNNEVVSMSRWHYSILCEDPNGEGKTFPYISPSLFSSTVHVKWASYDGGCIFRVDMLPHAEPTWRYDNGRTLSRG